MSFLDESHFGIIVCFSKKDVDTLFPQKKGKAVRNATVLHAILHLSQLVQSSYVAWEYST